MCARRRKLTLADAIRKFSALPAQRMRLTDRGVLKQGMWGDVVVFDPEKITDKATFEDPNQFSDGMECAGEWGAGDCGGEDDGGAAGEGAGSAVTD